MYTVCTYSWFISRCQQIFLYGDDHLKYFKISINTYLYLQYAITLVSTFLGPLRWPLFYHESSPSEPLSIFLVLRVKSSKILPPRVTLEVTLHYDLYLLKVGYSDKDKSKLILNTGGYLSNASVTISTLILSLILTGQICPTKLVRPCTDGNTVFGCDSDKNLLIIIYMF